MEEKFTKPIKKPKYKKKTKPASIYFLLWASFAVLSLIIVMIFSFTQALALDQTYREEGAKEITVKGRAIEAILKEETPAGFEKNHSGFVRYLAQSNGVEIFILSENGEVLYPREENIHPGSPEFNELYDMSNELDLLKRHLLGVDEDYVVYEGAGEFVYGSALTAGGKTTYLHISRSLDLIESVSVALRVRILFVAMFVFVFAFALSSALSGWLTKPVEEITAKAKLLAKGNFDVDFYGSDYASEMAELAKALNYAKDELSKTDRMQKELIANVSHDFKTPLTMIKAYSSMIKEISGDIPEKREKHAQVIIDEADRLASLVNDMLDLSKIRSGLNELKMSTFDLTAYLYDVLARFEDFVAVQGYSFILNIDEGIFTNADEVKIGQVLYNLIGNAINYTGADKKVYVSLRATKDGVARFSVRDTGSGIKKEELSIIWDRYYRSSETHQRPVKGTGLGLSIVKTILEKHNFRFGVESEVRHGSLFYVDFPVRKK